MRAYIVVDLGFGDSGKGLLTDFLVRHFDAGVVVRYNGGAQAGHNVIAPDGRHHTFSQFGSGTFVPGVQTYLSRHVVIHPGALLVEGDLLVGSGVRDAFSRLRISDRALVITPFHQAANRIRELARGQNRHGSCGVGVGEAAEDVLRNGNAGVRAGDLADRPGLREKLRLIREQKREELAGLDFKSPGGALAKEWEIFEKEDVIDAWISMIARIGDLGVVMPDAAMQHGLRQTGTVIFEGAQGVLLDQDAGFHPYTTWSRCTAANAYDLIAEMAPDSQLFRIGVMRSHAVRHGAGPLPTETDDFTSVVFDHNKYNEWQGSVRYGWFDALLTRYALAVTGGVDALAVTHMDVLSHFKTWKYCSSYTGQNGFDNTLADLKSDGVLANLHLPRFLSLAQRSQFTQALAAVKPVYETCEAEERQVIQKIESLVGQPVGIISRGPRAENVRILNSIL